jgi:hypothetical protein
MPEIITLPQITSMLEDIRDFYKIRLAGNPEFENVTWYSNALDAINGIVNMTSGRCSFYLDEVRPNMIAIQPDVSREKYELFGDVLPQLDWKVFPTLSIYSPEMDDNIQSDGHTRARLFHDTGRGYISTIGIRAPKEFVSHMETAAMDNGTMFGRPRKVAELPFKNWGSDEIDEGYRAWLNTGRKYHGLGAGSI